jgi:hypothetical protein
MFAERAGQDGMVKEEEGIYAVVGRAAEGLKIGL